MPTTISPITTTHDVSLLSRVRSRVGHGRLGRTMLVLLAVVAVAVPVAAAQPGGATAQTSDDAAREAAREIQAARDRANAAAEAYFQAQSDLEVLEDEAAGMERRAEALEERVEKLRRDVQAVAVARFATSGAEGIPLLTGLQAPKDQVQADVLVDVVTNAGTSSIDEFQAAQDGTHRAAGGTRPATARRSRTSRRCSANCRTRRRPRCKRLREIEEQRLTDEAVRQALAEQQAGKPRVPRRGRVAQCRGGRPRAAESRYRRGAGCGRAQRLRRRADPTADPDAAPAIAADAGAGCRATVDRCVGGYERWAHRYRWRRQRPDRRRQRRGVHRRHLVPDERLGIRRQLGCAAVGRAQPRGCRHARPDGHADLRRRQRHR